MVTKLWSMLPSSGSQSPELGVEGYVDALLDVPWPWLSVALDRRVKDPSTRWVPSVGEIRAEAAEAIRRQYRLAQGKPALPPGNTPLDTDRWINQARAECGMPLLAGAMGPGLDDRLEALAERLANTIGRQRRLGELS